MNVRMAGDPKLITGVIVNGYLSLCGSMMTVRTGTSRHDNAASYTDVTAIYSNYTYVDINNQTTYLIPMKPIFQLRCLHELFSF